MRKFIYAPDMVNKFNHVFDKDNWSLTDSRVIPMPRFMINSGGTYAFVRMESDNGLSIEGMTLNGSFVHANLFKVNRVKGVNVDPIGNTKDVHILYHDFECM